MDSAGGPSRQRNRKSGGDLDKDVTGTAEPRRERVKKSEDGWKSLDQPDSSTPSRFRPKRRRVSDDKRQRIEISCDRCKRRKIRCVRIKGTYESCEACSTRKVTCETTLPRKQKLYMSAESLDVKHSTAMAILKALYPDKPLNTLESITQLAKDLGVTIPSHNGNDIAQASTSTAAIWALGPVHQSQDSALPVMSSTPASSSSTMEDPGKVYKIPEGRLLPAPLGGFHYVGPASSIYFAITVRQLVAKTDLIRMAISDADLLERMIKAAEFTAFSVSQALEARIAGHPSTNATNDEGGLSVNDLEGSSYQAVHSAIPEQARTDNATTRSMLRHGRWRGLLPTRIMADRLVQAFFDRVHPNCPVFHRASFHSNYETIWLNDFDSPDSLDPGWICALMMTLVLGALALESEDFIGASDIQQRYLTVVLRDGLPKLSVTASVANVQAIMLLALYQHNAGERNGAWMLIGQAARTAVALGMHRDGDTSNFTSVERNIRRIVWWTLYIFEQNLSFTLGRPSATDIFDRTVRLPDDHVIDGRDMPPGYFGHLARLAELSIRVKRFAAFLSVQYDKPDALACHTEDAEEIGNDLDIWRYSLPQHLFPQAYFADERHRRAVLLLHVHYDYIRSILGRAFLLARVNHEIEHESTPYTPLDRSILQQADKALKFAKSSIDNIQFLAAHRLLEGQVWLDLFYVHHATFMLALPYLSRSGALAPQYQADRRAVSNMLLNCQRVHVAPTYRILLNIAMQLAYIVGMGPEDHPPATPPNASEEQGIHQAETHDCHEVDNIPAVPAHSAAQPLMAWDQLFGPLPSRQSSPQGLFADLYNYGLNGGSISEAPWDFFHLGDLTGDGQPVLNVPSSTFGAPAPAYDSAQ
ncbi:hypothetical protein I317_03946 [Kwoniella heveanensis CBS 569]|uniref:Zn(2)-C6 fungal-type domain-containing protein n=1 Tax=Kwoniella heveanensis BCC8398 TaxID=1296120 RepID=A0A1B9H3Z2_9TREE|nr:hypothetical protein I316_00209 [Kwoniella heveanensis BCC8398]OCF42211.1 hypothetical protein I317_03946 [Kwoniella heveanensis CBS 569]